MAEEVNEIEEEVWAQFEKAQSVFLATVEGEQPRVRPVTLIIFDKKFWIATGTGSAKTRQIRRNPNVEFCFPLKEGDNNGYVRVAGVAQTINDRQTKARLADQMDFFSVHWKGVDDPNYTLIQTTRVEVEYLRPGDNEAHTFVV